MGGASPNNERHRRRRAAADPPDRRTVEEASSLAELTNEVLNVKDTISAMHTWVSSISEASIDHAQSLENAAGDLSGIKSDMRSLKKAMQAGQQVAR